MLLRQFGTTFFGIYIEDNNKKIKIVKVYKFEFLISEFQFILLKKWRTNGVKNYQGRFRTQCTNALSTELPGYI